MFHFVTNAVRSFFANPLSAEEAKLWEEESERTVGARFFRPRPSGAVGNRVACERRAEAWASAVLLFKENGATADELALVAIAEAARLPYHENPAWRCIFWEEKLQMEFPVEWQEITTKIAAECRSQMDLYDDPFESNAHYEEWRKGRFVNEPLALLISRGLAS